MWKTITALAALVALAVAVAASAAKGVKYKGKTSSGHPIRFTLLNRRTKVITGTQRLQYEFLVPKFTPGTFSIYSCLGSGKFKAKPVK